MIAWENSPHFATPLFVSSRSDVWETTAEIRIHTDDLSLPRPEQCFWLVDSNIQIWISMEFPQPFLRRHFAGKRVVVSRYVGWFLRLFSWMFSNKTDNLDLLLVTVLVLSDPITLSFKCWHQLRNRVVWTKYTRNLPPPPFPPAT